MWLGGCVQVSDPRTRLYVTLRFQGSSWISNKSVYQTLTCQESNTGRTLSLTNGRVRSQPDIRVPDISLFFIGRQAPFFLHNPRIFFWSAHNPEICP
jgi:hypothetical protein